MNESRPAPLLMWVFTCLVLFFLVFPLLVVIPLSFGDASYLQFPPAKYSLSCLDASSRIEAARCEDISSEANGPFFERLEPPSRTKSRRRRP